MDLAQHFVRQVACALSYLESQHIAHRDVKPENLVLTAEYTVKLADFGYAIRAAPPPNGNVRSTFCGTPEFVPPEMVTLPSNTRKYYARHVDPWALGVLAYELVIGQSPFYVEECEKKRIAKKKGYEETYQVILDGIREFSSLERPEECKDDTFFDFCRGLVQLEARRRMSATEALEHAWLACCEDTSTSIGAPTQTTERTAKRAKIEEV